MSKAKRFFFHYNKPNKKISVHFNKTCYIVDDIVCSATTESKWNKKQPNLVIQGWARSFEIVECADDYKVAVIS